VDCCRIRRMSKIKFCQGDGGGGDHDDGDDGEKCPKR
jgi:hypothetical protein